MTTPKGWVIVELFSCANCGTTTLWSRSKRIGNDPPPVIYASEAYCACRQSKVTFPNFQASGAELKVTSKRNRRRRSQ